MVQSLPEGKLRIASSSRGRRTPWTKPRATSPSAAVSASVMRVPSDLENRWSQLADVPAGASLRGSIPLLFFFGMSGR